MTGPPRRRRTPRIRDEARALWRNAILDAAELVFAERGLAAARVQDIAARARLGVGTIYNYFEQKEDVLVALLHERTSAFLEVFQAAESDAPDYRARLLQRVTRLLEYIASHRPFFQLASEHGLFGGASTTATALLGGRHVPYAGRYEEVIRRLVEEGLEAGALAERPPALLSLQLRHCIRTSSQWMRTAHVDPAEAARAAVELFFDGAARQTPARAPRRATRR